MSVEKGEGGPPARTIPGNERAVSHTSICSTARRQVVHHEQPDIHVSGHACQEELKLMMNITPPKFFIPMHGTLRHLIHHRAAGGKRQAFRTDSSSRTGRRGDPRRRMNVLEDRVQQGKVFIDSEAEEVPHVVVRDRQHLAEDGFVIVVVAIDSNGRLIRDPEIITRGLVHVDASQEVMADVRRALVGMFDESAADELRDSDILQEKMRALLKRYFRKSMGRRPMILPVIWEM